MRHFPQPEIREIHQRAVATGLAGQRTLLFGGMADYMWTLGAGGGPAVQMLQDLDAMNTVGAITHDRLPLELWLRNASYLVALRPAEQKFFRDHADRAADAFAASLAAPPSSTTGIAVVDVLERIVHRDDLLPIEFLVGAAEVARSVARLTIGRFENGAPANHTGTNEQRHYFGTGWLIGPGHVITNHHVVNSRNDWEPDATAEDLILQCAKARVQFDYNALDVAGTEVAVSGVVATSKDLDYAILELAAPSDRTPLGLREDELAVEQDDPVPVNIVQHPGGGPKQVGMRNNLVAARDDRDLHYFTDTMGGSSGSPVCSDNWSVVALHKASTRKLGVLEFQGKTTAWVNQGTRIDRIIEDLRANHDPVWQAIGARLV